MNAYKNGIEFLCASGIVQPLGKQVLLKAILKNAQSELIKGTAAENSDNTLCYEVVAVGGEVTRVVPSMHCLQISTAATPSDFDLWEKKRARYCFVHEDDIVAAWDLDQAELVVKNSP